MLFVSYAGYVNNTIANVLIYNETHVNYKYGENSLSGVSTDFSSYYITYRDRATPTNENIDSMLQWTTAKKIHIIDNNQVAVSLFKRIDELSKFTQLNELRLVLQADTYDQIDVATFITRLPALKEVTFDATKLKKAQRKEFEAKNKIPSNWRLFADKKIFYYMKKSE